MLATAGMEIRDSADILPGLLACQLSSEVHHGSIDTSFLLPDSQAAEVIPMILATVLIELIASFCVKIAVCSLMEEIDVV